MARFNPGKRHELFTKKRKELWTQNLQRNNVNY
nr:MAG TPA: hypothetical protein [Caudoviricetes sp.]